MSDQSEAPRLAGLLDSVAHDLQHGRKVWMTVTLAENAAAELRRQHSRIEADKALMRQTLDLLRSLPWNEGYADDIDSAITALRKRLESSNG